MGSMTRKAVAMTGAEVRVIPLRRTLAEPLEATETFVRQLTMTHWTPRTWQTYSIPIWYGLPGLQEDLERILAALHVEHDRGVAPLSVNRARDACHQAGQELRTLEACIESVWTGRSQASVGSSDQFRPLQPLTDACNRLVTTLDRLIASVNVIAPIRPPDAAGPAV